VSSTPGFQGSRVSGQGPTLQGQPPQDTHRQVPQVQLLVPLGRCTHPPTHRLPQYPVHTPCCQGDSPHSPRSTLQLQRRQSSTTTVQLCATPRLGTGPHRVTAPRTRLSPCPQLSRHPRQSDRPPPETAPCDLSPCPVPSRRPALRLHAGLLLSGPASPEPHPSAARGPTCPGASAGAPAASCPASPRSPPRGSARRGRGGLWTDAGTAPHPPG
jgi:hypothetical protein